MNFAGDAGREVGKKIQTRAAEFVEVAWGAMRTGLYVTPINWHLTGGEAGYIVAGMELFRAADEEQLQYIKRIIDRSDVLAAGSVANSHVTDRVVKRVISSESAPRISG